MLKDNLKCNVVYFCFLLFLISLFNAPGLFAASVTLTWAPPTTNADGTPLTDLAGYKLYSGISSKNYTQNTDIGSVTSYTVTNLSVGATYYFALTAYDKSGNQSGFSNELIKTIAAVTYYCDKDKDGYINATADGTCAVTGCEPAGCQTTPGNDCDDDNANINPGASDANCNGIDDNCDGQVDEGYVPATTTCGVGACSASGQNICSNGAVVNTCTPHAPTAEVCGDGVDNNCNGQVDEGCTSFIKISKVLLTEDFSNGIPSSWSKQGAWNSDNTCGKTIASPFIAPYAITDSSCSVTGNDELTTPSFDTASCSNVELAFSNQNSLSNGTVDVAVSDNGGASWVNTIDMPLKDGYPSPDWKNIDISAVATTNDTKIKFSYTSNTTDGFWALDNIWVTCQPTQMKFSSTILNPSSTQTILVSNTGVSDLSVNKIAIDGTDASNFTVNNNGCSNQTLQPTESCTLDIIFLPGSVGPKSANLYIKSNDPNTPVISIPLAGPGTEIYNPTPDVKVKGLEGTVRIKQGGKAPKITLGLASESYEGINGDWWLLMQKKNLWYYYNPQLNKWIRGLRYYSQGALTNTTNIVTPKNTAKLPTGLYNIYFGVDTNMDGLQNPGQYYSDQMKVRIW